jgi:hypothetical protein
MLSLVVIGADDSVRTAFEPLDTDALFYDTAEDAEFGLSDLSQRGEEQVPDPIEHDETGRWKCSVVYGPKSFGPLATGQAAKLAHTGWTIVAAPNMRDTQTTPRRVSDGAVRGDDAATLPFEAMARVGANFLVDTTKATGDGSLSKLLELLGTKRFETP